MRSLHWNELNKIDGFSYQSHFITSKYGTDRDSVSLNECNAEVVSLGRQGIVRLLCVRLTSYFDVGVTSPRKLSLIILL